MKLTDNQPVTIPERDYQYIEQTGQKRSGCGWLIAGAVGGFSLPIIALLIILLSVLSGVTTFNSALTGIRDAITGIFDGGSATATVSSTQTVVNSIQPLGQLVSVSVQLAKADISVSVREGVLNSCSRTANHVAQGTIEAGVDLTQMRAEDVSYNALTDTYTITLPAPQITSCRLDLINQYQRSTSLCGPAWENIRLLGTYVALTDFRDDAIEGGILDRARSEAHTTLTTFLQLATGQNVIVQFQDVDPDSPVYPASCTPPTPGTWRYNVQDRVWEN